LINYPGFASVEIRRTGWVPLVCHGRQGGLWNAPVDKLATPGVPSPVSCPKYHYKYTKIE